MLIDARDALKSADLRKEDNSEAFFSFLVTTEFPVSWTGGSPRGNAQKKRSYVSNSLCAPSRA